MRQVPGPDAVFLQAELPEWHMHVASLAIVAPHTGSLYDAVRRIMVDRIHRMPQFRWVVRDPLLGLDRPLFVDDPDYDLDNHLHHIAVPAPGGREELGELVGDLISRKVDRRRPLWETWVIDGLAGGRSAVLSKVHHSIIDGVSGSDQTEVLYDLEPDPPPDPPPPPYRPEPAPPWHRVALATTGSMVRLPLRTARLVNQLVRQAVTMTGFSRGEDAPPAPFSAPRTSFNGRLSAHRLVATATVPLGDVKAVRRAAGVKLNDVILAVCAGVLRGYLEDRDELPERPLVASVPVSTRTDESRDQVGTQVANMFVSLATDVSEPRERLEAIAAGTSRAKEMRQALGADKIINLSDATPPAVFNLAARMWTAARLEAHTPPVFNLVVSNVPGPAHELYLGGAHVEALYPMGPLILGSGLEITVFSVADALHFGFVVDRGLVPDPWNLADRVAPALAALTGAIVGT